MKALIIFRNTSTDWIRQFFAGIEPCLLPIVNKPLVAYILDFFILLGVKEIRIVTEGARGLLEKYLVTSGYGGLDGVTITCSLIREEDTFSAILMKNRNFWMKEQTYYMYGYSFIFYNQALRTDFKAMFAKLMRTEARDDFFCGVLKPTQRKLPALVTHNKKHRYFNNLYNTKHLAAIPLANCKDYYQLSMRILNDFSDHYFLRNQLTNKLGAKKDDNSASLQNLMMGKKTILKKDTLLKEKFFIGDHAVIQRDCIIGKGTIISDEVFIDEGTRVVNSIILPRTYLGKWLNVTDAIVYNKTLIHIPSGHVIDFEDEHIAGTITHKDKWRFLRRSWEVPVALVLLGLQLPFHMLFATFSANYYSIYRKRIFCYLNKKFEIMERWVYQLERGNAMSWLFMQLFLDKRELLKDVLQGRLALIGNCPLEASLESKKTIKMMYDYRPGAFWYSEVTDPFLDEESELIINELYFTNHQMMFKSLRVFSKLFFRRLLKWV